MVVMLSRSLLLDDKTVSILQAPVRGHTGQIDSQPEKNPNSTSIFGALASRKGERGQEWLVPTIVHPGVLASWKHVSLLTQT